MLSGDDKIAQIMRRYSHLFVECDNSEVQHFYLMLSLYFAKCDGLLSAAEVHRLESTTRGLVAFSAYLTPIYEKQAITVRLEFLKKHNISKPGEIMRLLTQGMLEYGYPETSDRRYMVEFTQNPGKPFNWYSDRLGVSVSSVTRAYQRLCKAIGFHFYSQVNYPLLKLKHFTLFFKPDEPFRSSMLSAKEFAITLNCDTFGEWKWASFVVPNQDRILNEFKGGLAGFASEVLRDYRLYEIKSFGWHCNLPMFDGEKWLFSEESFGIRLFEDAEANKQVLPRLKEFPYGERPIRFDKLDFLLSFQIALGLLAENSKVRAVIGEYGYGDLSGVTVSKRLAALKRNGVFFPSCIFSGLGLNSMSIFAAECDERTLETLYRMLPMVPECWAYRTDKGVVGCLMVPDGMLPAVSYMMQGLRSEVESLITTSRLRNIGGRQRPNLYRYWNAERQCWDFERGFFDLSKNVFSSSRN